MVSFEQIFSTSSLLTAWESVKQKNKSGGIDNVTICDFQKDIEPNIKKLQAELYEYKYIPEPYKRFYIQKDVSGLRPLSLLTIKDKVIQQCFFNYFNFKIDKTFADTSYAYRANKSHTKAINRIQDFINRGCKWFCPVDIDNYFDSINRKILIEKCSNIFQNEKIIKLIEMWTYIGSIQNGKYVDSGKGIPQGGVISPMLSNIYLNDYDKAMKTKSYDNVRYADNILLISKEKDKLLETLGYTVSYLKDNLGLSLNKIEKNAVNITEPFTFCGIQFNKGKKVIDPHKYDRMIQDFEQILKKGTLIEISSKISQHFDGINRYYFPFDTKEQIGQLQEKFFSLISSKLKTELQQKIIPAISEAKNILRQITFIGSQNNVPKEFFVNNIINRIKEDKFEPAKTALINRDVSKAINIKRRQYQKFWYDALDINIPSLNSQIGKSGYKIIIRREGKIKNEISADKIQNILISAKGVTISSDAVRLCAEKNIRINYFDELGKPYASMVSLIMPVLSIGKQQVSALMDDKGKIIIKSLISAKVKNQLSAVKYFIKNKKLDENDEKLISAEIERMNNYIVEIKSLSLKQDIEELKGKVFGFEGLSASSYWNALKVLIPAGYSFEKREHQYSKDIVNMMLNYSYGILYTRVLNAVISNGLDPTISFLHSGQKGKPTLVFDLIEQFRAPVADRSVVAMLTKNVKVSVKNNLLSDDTKNKLANKVLFKLNNEFYYKGKLTSFNEIIYLQVKNLANYLKGETKIFKPFLSKW